eukprot:TRINITY_DN5240_c3_g1_i1.p4 TRINITY_DN5240_c3_g1~~TRINITY_DN5240_c3_g1_i1.p4  ORF type:complete len:101 (-),score=1.12 TRINITY_DN5240_c3_g1_i1:331-633(-)
MQSAGAEEQSSWRNMAILAPPHPCTATCRLGWGEERPVEQHINSGSKMELGKLRRGRRGGDGESHAQMHASTLGGSGRKTSGSHACAATSARLFCFFLPF